MLMDHATLRSLEIVQSSDGERKNSLLDLLDLSQTAMGARRIREWVLKPLIDINSINKRLEQVYTFRNNPILRQAIRDRFKSIYDLERLLSRISLSVCNARDLITLKISLSALPHLSKILNQSSKIKTLYLSYPSGITLKIFIVLLKIKSLTTHPSLLKMEIL